MCKNTTKSPKREARFGSGFWRAVIGQACINQALSIMMNEIECLKEELNVQLWGIEVLGDVHKKVNKLAVITGDAIYKVCHGWLD
ncbi:hypothetical protein MYX76_12105 [Desulfobacterota bacterium AH_259_B03_O07]|nr:hypothetical protein [Desulfobacterota bacterium AH_259_B03_O07]